MLDDGKAQTDAFLGIPILVAATAKRIEAVTKRITPPRLREAMILIVFLRHGR